MTCYLLCTKIGLGITEAGCAESFDDLLATISLFFHLESTLGFTSLYGCFPLSSSDTARSLMD